MGGKAASLEDTAPGKYSGLGNSCAEHKPRFDPCIWVNLSSESDSVLYGFPDMAKAEFSQIGLMSPFTTGTFPGWLKSFHFQMMHPSHRRNSIQLPKNAILWAPQLIHMGVSQNITDLPREMKFPESSTHRPWGIEYLYCLELVAPHILEFVETG